MASTLTWTFLLCAVATLTTAFPKSGRIVGGESASIEEFPWIVQVDGLGVWNGVWSQMCGGNILTSRFFMSAAHCFVGFLYQPSHRRIRAGATFRNAGGIISNVVKEFNHPSYGQNGLDADVSVILLETPLEWNAVIQPSTIAAPNTVIPEGLPVVHAGWGRLASGGATPVDLQKVTIYTINQELCAERYYQASGLEVTENMICAGILDVGGKDACQGDSGGPLYYEDIVIGVVSWGTGCAEPHYPGVSTAVSPYTEWMIQTVNANS